MALPVLPYPNMDFTPLDVLTAAELDQMVANDEYLRNYCESLADGTNAPVLVPDYGGTLTQVTTFPYTVTTTAFARLSTNGNAIAINNRQVANGQAYIWTLVAVGDIITTLSPAAVAVYLFPIRAITV